MQSICHLSRRWHQQFCRSPSFVSHQGCLRQWQPIRQYRARPNPGRAHETAKPTHTGDFVVREYEQYGSDSSTRKPVDPDEDLQEEEDLRQQLKRLEAELNEMKQGPFGPKSEFMQSLPQKERAELLKALEAEGGQRKIEELLADEELDLGEDGDGAFAPEEEGYEEEEDEDNEGIVQDPLSVTLRVPAQHKVYVKNFNDYLLLAQNELDHFPHHLDLWKWYLRCQQHIPGFSKFVNEDVWDFLWKSQTVHFPRPKQIVMLAKDMIGADINLDTSQTVDYISALHDTGDTATAIEVWEHMKPRVPLKSEHASRFWEAGVQIYAAVGRPKKAQDIASAGFEKKVVSTEAWVPVIQAWADSKKPSAGSSLWACYLRLKQQQAKKAANDGSSTSRIPLPVLGQISSALLNSGRRDMAVSVFKDMLTSDAHEQFDSAHVYTHLLDQLQGVDKSEVSESIINRIGLAALTAFPGRFKNKFFFGAWIKWLLGEGKVDDAALVVELMQEYGIRPDAKHLNGIIGAWLRQASSTARERAEQMAWAMIHSRINQVKARSATPLPATPSPINSSTNPYPSPSRLPRFLQRNVPPATIETFSILLQRYTRSSDTSRAEYLTEILTGPAAIKPNAFILNHWMYLSLRSADLNGMWSRYTQVKREIAPDLETFAALWDGCKKNLDRGSTVHVPSYPKPRQLAREMKAWFDDLPAAKRQESIEAFSRELYEQILRCFCLHSDLHGLTVMVGALREMFRMYPHEDVARMVVLSVARMLPLPSSSSSTTSIGNTTSPSSSSSSSSPLFSPTPPQTHLKSKPRRAAIRRRDAAYRAALGGLGEVMQGITDIKASQTIGADGVTLDEVEDIEGEVAMRVRLDAIRLFLGVVLRRGVVGGRAVGGEGEGDKAEKAEINEIVMAAKAVGTEVQWDTAEGWLREAEQFDR